MTTTRRLAAILAADVAGDSRLMGQNGLSMRRRDFIAAVGGVLIAPGSAFAAKSPPVVGFLSAFAADATSSVPDQIVQGLREIGYVEGRNVAFEKRAANADYDRLRTFAEELVRLDVTVIAAYGLPAALAAKATTSTLPIVFWTAGDPVADGLVASLGRPGANMTGVAVFNNGLTAKRLELLRQLTPNAKVYALLVNPGNQNAAPQSKDAQAAAAALGVQLIILNARTDSEIEQAFAALGPQRVDGLAVASDPFLFAQRERVVALAARSAIPTIYTVRSYCQAGGLISYTGDSGEALVIEYGRYIGRVLKGEKPADMPVHQSTRFALAVNMKSAKALGLTIPPALLAQADEVIE